MTFVVKFWLCIGSIALGYFITISLDVVLALQNEDRMKITNSSLFPATMNMERIRDNFEQQLKLYENGVVQGEKNMIESAVNNQRKVQEKFEEILAMNLPDSTERDTLSSIAERHRIFSRNAAEVYTALCEAKPSSTMRDRAQDIHEEALSIQSEIVIHLELIAHSLRQGLDEASIAMRRQRTIGLTVFIIVVSASFIGIALVMNAWSSRMRSLLRVSNQLAGGDYNAVLPISSSDELGQLTDSFAAMRGAVQERAKELREFNDRLEEIVIERTRELADKNASLSAEIAERERAQNALRLLEAAVNQINEAVIIGTPGRTLEEIIIQHVNPAFFTVTGWKDSEVHGKPLSIMMGPSTDREAFLEIFINAADGKDGAAEIMCRRRNGTDYPGEWHVSPIRSADGTVCNVVAIQRDITERKRTQAELETANRQAGMAAIATGVLHNVGNVLNSVNVSASLLTERLTNPRVANLGRSAQLLKEGADIPDFLRADNRGRQLPDYLGKLVEVVDQDRAVMQEELKNLVAAVEHIKAIVNMQQSHAKSGGGAMVKIRLVEICEEVLRMKEESFKRHTITVRKEYAELPAMNFDKHKIVEILINLVTNSSQALEKTNPGERVLTVGTRLMEEGRVQVWVADNGQGIPAESLAKIFNHGFTTKAEGHGFGLHSCANAASEMGGKLSVTSDGPGKGARFILELKVQK